MSRPLLLLALGLAVGAVGGGIFYLGLRLIDRQRSTPGTLGSCLVALLGAVVIFLGVGLLAAAMLVP